LRPCPEVPRSDPCRNGSWSELPSAVHRQHLTFWDIHCFESSSFMFTRARQEPWITAVVASGALGLALYYLSARLSSPANTPKQPPESEKPSQDSTTDFVAEDMTTEERAYHERFMREAIGMVSHFAHLLHLYGTVSQHVTDQSRATGRACTDE
jgi:hypothetical protein